MTAQEKILYQDTFELIRLYNHPPYPEFKSDFQHPRAYFRGKPIKFYIRLLVNLAPLTRTKQNLLPYLSGGYTQENIDHLFTRFYENTETRELLHHAALGQLGAFTTTAGEEYVEVHRKFEDPNTSNDEKEKAAESFADKHLKNGKEKVSERTTSEPIQGYQAKPYNDRTARQLPIEPLILRPSVVNLAPTETKANLVQKASLTFKRLDLGIPGVLKSLGTRALITTRNLILNTPRSFWLGAILGGVGGFFGGGGIVGIVGGLVAGAFLASIIFPKRTNLIQSIFSPSQGENQVFQDLESESTLINQSSSQEIYTGGSQNRSYLSNSPFLRNLINSRVGRTPVNQFVSIANPLGLKNKLIFASPIFWILLFGYLFLIYIFFLSGNTVIPQTGEPTTSPNPITETSPSPSNPTNVSSSSILDYAISLANQVWSACPPQINQDNQSCLDSTNPTIDPLPLSQLHFCMQYCGLYWLQCTDFVEAVVAKVTGSPLPHRAAEDYIGYSDNNFTYIPKNSGQDPQPGDIALWDDYCTIQGCFGHIGIIENYGGADQMTVIDADYVQFGKIAEHYMDPRNTKFAGWLRLNK